MIINVDWTTRSEDNVIKDRRKFDIPTQDRGQKLREAKKASLR